LEDFGKVPGYLGSSGENMGTGNEGNIKNLGKRLRNHSFLLFPHCVFYVKITRKKLLFNPS